MKNAPCFRSICRTTAAMAPSERRGAPEEAGPLGGDEGEYTPGITLCGGVRSKGAGGGEVSRFGMNALTGAGGAGGPGRTERGPSATASWFHGARSKGRCGLVTGILSRRIRSGVQNELQS